MITDSNVRDVGKFGTLGLPPRSNAEFPLSLNNAMQRHGSASSTSEPYPGLEVRNCGNAVAVRLTTHLHLASEELIPLSCDWTTYDKRGACVGVYTDLNGEEEEAYGADVRLSQELQDVMARIYAAFSLGDDSDSSVTLDACPTTYPIVTCLIETRTKKGEGFSKYENPREALERIARCFQE